MKTKDEIQDELNEIVFYTNISSENDERWEKWIGYRDALEWVLDSRK